MNASLTPPFQKPGSHRQNIPELPLFFIVTATKEAFVC